MTNLDLKNYIKEYVSDDEISSEVVILEGDEFANGFLGLTADTYQAVYSYERLVVSLMRHYEWSEIEAIEWLDHNTLQAIPYMPLRKPIIIHEK